MKVYEAVSYVTGEGQGIFYPGIFIENSQVMRDTFLLSGMAARPLDEANKVYRMAAMPGADNLFSSCIVCDDVDCGCYGARWYWLFVNGRMMMGPALKVSVDGVIDSMLSDYPGLYEIPLTEAGEVDYDRLDRGKL